MQRIGSEVGGNLAAFCLAWSVPVYYQSSETVFNYIVPSFKWLTNHYVGDKVPSSQRLKHQQIYMPWHLAESRDGTIKYHCFCHHAALGDAEQTICV